MDFKIKTSRELTLDDYDVRDILLQNGATSCKGTATAIMMTMCM